MSRERPGQPGLPASLSRGTGVGRVTSLPEPVPYHWREAEQRRDAEVAARLAAVRARLAAKGGTS
jgi:hypothetical protein